MPPLEHPRVCSAPMGFDFSAEALDREFPVRRQLIYLNHAAVAPLPRRVSDAIVAHTENTRDRGAADWRRWYGGIEAARDKAARFIGAEKSAVSFLPSTSWGLNLVAQAFPWREGDNVVGNDMEFPANVYPWMLLGARGVEHRRAASRGGRVTADDIASAIDGRTRMVAVSWVAFHNGWVYPLEEIGALCRERGILFVVDAIQGLGALPLDLARRRARRRRAQVAPRAGGLRDLLRLGKRARPSSSPVRRLVERAK